MAVTGYQDDSTYAHIPIHGMSPEMYYIKGSIEAILDRCKFYYVNEESTPALDADTRSMISARAHNAASQGLRVLAMAYAEGSMDEDNGYAITSRTQSRTGSPRSNGSSTLADRTNLVFVGFQAMLDPPRQGVVDAINLLQAGGVQVVMITGDAEATALSIAQKLGMRVGGKVGGVGVSNMHCLTGKAIDQMTKAQLKESVGGVSVFARTTPKHKMAIVEAFQSRGAVVAMTGDGGE